MKKQRSILGRKIASAAIVLGVAVMLPLGAVQAQGGGGPSGDIPKFLELGPKVGEMVPDLTILDDAGNPVSIRGISKDNYSVFVLGCLT
jgi:hypothetical protein